MFQVVCCFEQYDEILYHHAPSCPGQTSSFCPMCPCCICYPLFNHLITVLVIRMTVIVSQCLCSSNLYLMLYNCSIIIGVNFLLCIIYKLNMMTGMHVQENHSIYRAQYYLQFQAHTGGHRKYILWIRGTTVSLIKF